MSFLASVSVTYKDIFDDYDSIKIEELLEGIPTKNSLEIMGYSLAQLHTLERDTSLQFEFLKIWTERFSKPIQDKIQSFSSKHSSNGHQFNFINNISALTLISYLLKYHNDLPLAETLTEEQELNLFKAYLWSTQQWINKTDALNIKKVQSDEDLAKLIIPIQLPYQELLEFKDFRIQFIKAIYFFRFCEINVFFSKYLGLFTSEYNLTSWKEYITNIMSLYLRKFERMKTPSVIEIKDSDKAIIDFLNNFCIDVSTFKITDDFHDLRENPVYRIKKNRFVFLNFNFLIDKIFQGIQFEFTRILAKNDAEYKGKRIKNFDDFKSIYGQEFSEPSLFYNVMKFNFERSGFVKYSGDELKPFLNGKEPDYYLRDKSKIYLFEYKDVLINAETKHSYDFEVIFNEILKKMLSNQKGSPKGVTQLVNSIELIINNAYCQFDKFDFSNCIIFPIIVYTDFTFNLVGVNYLLNKIFRKLLKDRGIDRQIDIQDLILIDIDNLIKFQDLFREKKLKLNNCFYEYYESLKDDKDKFNRIASFSMFLHYKTAKMQYDTPKMLREEALKIIPTSN